MHGLYMFTPVTCMYQTVHSQVTVLRSTLRARQDSGMAAIVTTSLIPRPHPAFRHLQCLETRLSSRYARVVTESGDCSKINPKSSAEQCDGDCHMTAPADSLMNTRLFVISTVIVCRDTKNVAIVFWEVFT